MEYDSASNCEGRLRDFEASEDLPRLREIQKLEGAPCTANSTPWQSLQAVAPQPKLKPGTTNKSLSSQVMEYYHKYSQNTNLDQYFSLPTTSTSPEAIKCYYSIYEVNPKIEANRQDCIGEEYNLRSYVPRERRRWVRPPLIGQSSNTDSSSSRYVQPLSNPESPPLDLKHVTPETILEEKNESQEILTESMERKVSSPTSSIASHKPLEWDSGADVGYFNTAPNSKRNDKKLSTIERMALARGCSAALRLDPEGTTESGISGKLAGVQKKTATSMTPNANSTALLGNASGSESEIEITPIVKNHLPGIIAGSGIKSAERSLPRDFKQQDTFMQYSKKEYSNDTPKSTFTTKVPFAKPPTEIRKVSSKQNTNKENICPPTSPLKRSTSMNTLFIPHSKCPLKRSQSELNLYARDKSRAPLPLIFNSSSSIATIVNKPSTCDKVIQTSLYAYTQESVGVQVSVLEEEKPPLPKRGTSLQRGSTLKLKNPKGTYKVDNSRKQETNDTRDVGTCECSKEVKPRRNYSELSQNGPVRQTSQPDDAGNITGRANSFEYFPGHVYENVPNGSGSHISSSETARSHSTLPNTSSSINEKLWGDSDSLVRDLERSVNILKSLVDANKCDKEVKKRLIHHVVKRLITAKYTDDKIEHNLEDNVPWNPDDARSKVYGREILEALSKQRNTSDSSREWNPQKEMVQGKCVRNGRDMMKDIALESSSDKMDKNTDRTETDGRKARLGLRSDDCHRSSNTITDPDKSGSSECFFPQRSRKGNKVQDIFCVKERCKISQRDSTMTTTTTTTTMTTTTNGTPPDHNRMLLDAVVNNRRGVIRSSNTEEQDDWRLLTTFSERQFELKKSGSTVSADSKLVSYAEMEKRNQLIWITNEISHLRNLKKLLEEPRRPERPRTSPKKSRPGNFKRKPMGPLSRVHELCTNDYSHRNGSEARMNSMEEPWSSHCNLATCQVSSRSHSIVQRIKKRNSCAQTATNITGALSKTGGEIVSASNLHNSSSKLVSTGVQTVPQETYTIPALIQSGIVHYVKCPTHNAMQVQNGYKCSEQASQCLKYHAIQNLVTTCMQCAQEQKDQSSNVQKVHTNIENFREESSVDSRTPSDQMNSIISSEVTHHCANKEVQTGSLKQKEAKNQINASKSKFCDCKGSFVCRCTSDCKCESKKASGKGCQSGTSSVTAVESNSVSKCEECQKTLQTRDRGEEKLQECNCTTVCECDKDQTKKGRAPMKYSSKYYQNSNGYVSSSNQNGCTKLCGCPNDCYCENSRESEVQGPKGVCSCHANGKTQYEARYTRAEAEDRSTQPRPYCVTNGQANETAQYKVQNANLKCDCEKDSYCNGRGKNEEEALHGRACNSGKPNYVDEANQTSDSDRNCKYCRRCGIPYQSAKKCSCYQTYPKAIAYELSFGKEDGQKNDNFGAFLKVPLSNRAINEGKTDGCVCDMFKKVSLKKNSAQKSTLQDYLSKNKADFVSNAETRRQYMSEICHLRQLRKEKRIQLLAMASTSNVIKSPKASSKPTVYTQRKVSDEEMRERLRKRYLRLNEMRQKRRQQEKQEESRRNKLMAKIFCKKLQQKVLRGQVNLSQSVSVISNM